MQKITPHLWFDTQAKEAAKFYTETFSMLKGGESKIKNTTTIHDTPSGSADIVTIDLVGQEFTLLNAGPYFTFNPSISFFLNFDPSKDDQAAQNIDEMWEKLSEGGKVLMEIQEYPFSKRYGWLQDKYGVSWQLILTDPEGEERPFIVPSLLFVGDVNGRAEEAMNYYMSVFKDSKKGTVARYGKDQGNEKEDAIMFADFMIEKEWFVVMDSGENHEFAFSEATSFLVHCENQEEIDYYWEKLSAVPEAEQCGWLKDKFGVSWQIVPNEMDKMMEEGDEAAIARVTQAFLPMKKFDIAELKKAYEG